MNIEYDTGDGAHLSWQRLIENSDSLVRVADQGTVGSIPLWEWWSLRGWGKRYVLCHILKRVCVPPLHPIQVDTIIPLYPICVALCAGAFKKGFLCPNLSAVHDPLYDN